MDRLNVLLIGSGGREHALAFKIAQSPVLGKLFAAPGNPGTSAVAANLDIQADDFEGIRQQVLANDINLVVVGPEEPLVKGLHDFFLADTLLSHIPVIGPTAQGAMLEGSKDFAKQFMLRHNIPTAAYRCFDRDHFDEGTAFLQTFNPPYVLKADGLAAGKGVAICSGIAEAETVLREMLLEQKFGSASAKVVIEEFLDGIELSAFALTDGKTYLVLPCAKDYKRIGEGDTGPNTGGMGSVSPVPFAGKEFMKKVEDRIIKPTVEGLAAEGIRYTGFLFFGLMNVNGDPYVIEYNVRLGDPETESVLPRIKSDLLAILAGAAKGQLSEFSIETDDRCAACVMVVSGGYPGSYAKGKPVSGLENVQGSLVFHSGTALDNGKLVTAGGRVVAVTSLHDDLQEAVRQSMQAAAQISFDGAYFRRDIGADLLAERMNR